MLYHLFEYGVLSERSSVCLIESKFGDDLPIF